MMSHHVLHKCSLINESGSTEIASEVLKPFLDFNASFSFVGKHLYLVSDSR